MNIILILAVLLGSFLDLNSIAANSGEIPSNAEKLIYRSGWKCKKGFKKNGESCSAVVIPSNAKLNYVGNDWECKKGFKKDKKTCSEVAIPKNASLNYRGNGWSCNRGYKKKGGQCSSVLLPKNAKLNYAGNGWECRTGFKLKKHSSCEKVVLPVNSSLNYRGDGWSCNKGFKRAGGICEKLDIPDNAKLDYLGNDWKCKTGFMKEKNLCRELSRGELIEQMEEERKVSARILRYASQDPCDRALEQCKRACPSTIHNYDSGNYISTSNTDFANNCEDSCVKGKSACEESGKSSRCDGFKSTCSRSCPSEVYFYSSGDYSYNTDANSKCDDACRSGSNHCE